jgi:hypothetical protein
MPQVDEKEMKTRFEPFKKQMQDAGLNDIAIEAFRHYYYQLLSGGAGGEYYLLRVCYAVVGIIRKNLITLLEFSNSYCRVMVCF